MGATVSVSWSTADGLHNATIYLTADGIDQDEAVTCLIAGLGASTDPAYSAVAGQGVVRVMPRPFSAP